ncbi:hypothetical protein P7C70_g9405, partial [Phenoliferia sp. Uapishka_3]
RYIPLLAEEARHILKFSTHFGNIDPVDAQVGYCGHWGSDAVVTVTGGGGIGVVGKKSNALTSTDRRAALTGPYWVARLLAGAGENLALSRVPEIAATKLGDGIRTTYEVPGGVNLSVIGLDTNKKTAVRFLVLDEDQWENELVVDLLTIRKGSLWGNERLFELLLDGACQIEDNLQEITVNLKAPKGKAQRGRSHMIATDPRIRGGSVPIKNNESSHVYWDKSGDAGRATPSTGNNMIAVSSPGKPLLSSLKLKHVGKKLLISMATAHPAAGQAHKTDVINSDALQAALEKYHQLELARAEKKIDNSYIDGKEEGAMLELSNENLARFQQEIATWTQKLADQMGLSYGASSSSGYDSSHFITKTKLLSKDGMIRIPKPCAQEYQYGFPEGTTTYMVSNADGLVSSWESKKRSLSAINNDCASEEGIDTSASLRSATPSILSPTSPIPDITVAEEEKGSEIDIEDDSSSITSTVSSVTEPLAQVAGDSQQVMYPGVVGGANSHAS